MGKLNYEIEHQQAIASGNTKGNSHALAQIDGMQIVKNSKTAYELYNTPHNYVSVQVRKPALKARSKPVGYGTKSKVAKKKGPSSQYRRRF